jgi:hypothetical protein
MSVKKFFLVFLFNSVSLQAFAWTSSGKVTEVMSHNGVHIVHTTITDGSCSAPGMFFWPADEASEPDAKDMLSIALAALMGDKFIRMADTGADDCASFGASRGT